MSKTGRMYRYRVVAALGDGCGCVGIEQANRIAVRDALSAAFSKCAGSMITVHLEGSRTVPFGFKHKVHKSEVLVYPLPPGGGLHCPNVIAELCHVMGIKDLKVRVNGSGNPLNVVKAFFEGLKSQLDIENIALIRGVPINTLKSHLTGKH